MYANDRAENLVPSENADRKKSSNSKSIWSIKSDCDQTQFSLDLVNANSSQSTANPSSKPLPPAHQLPDSYQDVSKYSESTEIALMTGFAIQYPDSNANGMDISCVDRQSEKYPSNLSNTGQVRNDQVFSNVNNFQQFRNSHNIQDVNVQRKNLSTLDLDQHQHRFSHDNALTTGINIEQTYSYSSTTNYATQNLQTAHKFQDIQNVPQNQPQNMPPNLNQNLYNLQQNSQQNLQQQSSPQVPIYSAPSPYSEYTGMSQEQYRRAEAQRSFSGSRNIAYNSGYAPNYEDERMARAGAEMAISPTNTYARISGENYASTATASTYHTRRHLGGHRYSYPNEPLDSTIIAKVDQYFTQDTLGKVRVTGAVLQTCLQNERALLSPNYGFPDFNSTHDLKQTQLVLVAFKAGRLEVFYIPSENVELQNLQEGMFVIVEADRGRNLGKVYKVNVSWAEARVLGLLEALQLNVNFGDRYSKELRLSQLQHYESRFNNSRFNQLASPRAVIGLASPNEIFQILRKSNDEDRAGRINMDQIISNIIANKNSQIELQIESQMDSSDEMQMEFVTAKQIVSSNPEELRNVRFVDFEYQFDRKKLIIDYTAPRRVDFRDMVREIYSIFKTRIWMSAAVGLNVNNSRRSTQTFRGNIMRGGSSYRPRMHGRGSGSQQGSSGSFITSHGSQTSVKRVKYFGQNSGQDTGEGAAQGAGRNRKDGHVRNIALGSTSVSRNAFVPRLLRASSQETGVDATNTEMNSVTKSLVENLHL